MLSMYETAIGTAAHKAGPGKRSRLSSAEKLYRDLQAHAAREEAALAETERAKELALAPVTKFVLDLIDDRQGKQVELVERMAASLRDALYWTYSPEALPDATSGRERAATAEALRNLVQLERQRARSAKRLAKSFAGINGGLERALLEASAAQSQSNVRLLRLLIERLGQGDTSASQPRTLWDAALRDRKLAAERDQAA